MALFRCRSRLIVDMSSSLCHRRSLVHDIQRITKACLHGNATTSSKRKPLSVVTSTGDAPEWNTPQKIQYGQAVFASPCTLQRVITLDNMNEMVHENDRLQIAFVGRSNVGKSSLLNALLGRPLARMSAVPGQTRRLYFFDLDFGPMPLTLVDLPGYGFAHGRPQDRDDWKKLIMSYLERSVSLRRIISLVDIKHGVKRTDEMLFEMLDQMRIPYQLVLTKADRISPSEADAATKAIAEKFGAKPFCSPFVHTVSTVTGDGLVPLRASLASVLTHIQEDPDVM
eukprot:GILK01008463.1.p1 GENE.GILK01008463.1~~GILK01008463.1.p1  ORF type:complete len:296 (-),score=30.67 GILK01008463.1:262-1110(-)